MGKVVEGWYGGIRALHCATALVPMGLQSFALIREFQLSSHLS